MEARLWYPCSTCADILPISRLSVFNVQQTKCAPPCGIKPVRAVGRHCTAFPSPDLRKRYVHARVAEHDPTRGLALRRTDVLLRCRPAVAVKYSCSSNQRDTAQSCAWRGEGLEHLAKHDQLSDAKMRQWWDYVVAGLSPSIGTSTSHDELLKPFGLLFRSGWVRRGMYQGNQGMYTRPTQGMWPPRQLWESVLGRCPVSAGWWPAEIVPRPRLRCPISDQSIAAALRLVYMLSSRSEEMQHKFNDMSQNVITLFDVPSTTPQPWAPNIWRIR